MTAPIRAFLHRIARTAYVDLDDTFVAEAMRTGGGVLWPMPDRHMGRALITLHGLTATGHTMPHARRNWMKMAQTAAGAFDARPMTQPHPQPQGARYDPTA